MAKKSREHSPLEYKLDDDGKLYHKYINKCNNAKKENLRCLLTFSEFCELVDNAGLLSSDLGFSGKGYVLARYNDSGDYTYDNCRFITQKENVKERKITEKSRLTSINNMKKVNACYKDSQERYDAMMHGIHKSRKFMLRRLNARLRKINNTRNYTEKYGDWYIKNTGTFWINNGKENKRWKSEYGNIPDGYIKGYITH